MNGLSGNEQSWSLHSIFGGVYSVAYKNSLFIVNFSEYFEGLSQSYCNNYLIEMSHFPSIHSK